ncbi:hypothetical protein C4D60_Mb05t18920 [Musa balbisiana]|uniref:Pentatricopeptide repeat-containing protein n=1 Tax=Musa balbisiana TaxID=52838 RepID=A0A4S8JX79_MUSBA|nr:hypothetical protein C4D60_Mb05t18920 [Musa balbisiana]
MWRSSSYSRSLLRTLLGGSQRRIECRSVKHPILLWPPLAFLSSSSLYVAAGGVGGGSAAESITFVDAPKQKLERGGAEVIGYPQLLEGTGLGRFRDEAVACRMLHGPGAVLLFRTTVCSRPSKFVAGYCCENYATSSSSYSTYDGKMDGQTLGRGEARPERLANLPGGALQTGAAWALARAQALGASGERLGKPRRPNQDFRSGSKDCKVRDCNYSNLEEPVEKKVGKNISSVEKRKFLVNTLLDLKDSKEAVYGTLDAWVAWEQSFPLVTLKKALLVLEKEEQWHRVVQVIKWMLSKGQGTTMGTYEQLIRALEKDNRAEEAHRIWVKKISHDLHSVPWRFCDLMLSIYYRNNMLERLVKLPFVLPPTMQLFQELEAYDRKPPSKSVVRKVGDAYEVLGLLEKKNKLLEKYNNLFSEISDKTSRSSKRSKRVAGINGERTDRTHTAAKDSDSGPLDAEIDARV